MTDHTLSLSVLIVLATFAPSELIRAVAYLGGHPGQKGFERYEERLRRFGMPLLYILIAFLVLYLTPQESRWESPALAWYAMAFVLAPVVIGAEIGFTFAWLRLLKKQIGRVSLSPVIDDNAAIFAMLSVIIGGAEEIIFRGVWIPLLVDTHSIPVEAAVAVSAIVYGFNHSYFGIMTVLQKSVSGLLYGIFFVISGLAIVVPVVVHVTQNLLLVGARKYL